jgi:hypothetical protein
MNEKTTLIPIVSVGLSQVKQPLAAFTHDSNMKYTVIFDNRFHQSDSTIANHLKYPTQKYQSCQGLLFLNLFTPGPQTAPNCSLKAILQRIILKVSDY